MVNNQELPEPEPNECIVCGEEIPYHHACLIIPIAELDDLTIDDDDIVVYACVSCEGGVKDALENR